MAITLITAPGASNANSFATLEEADAYHETRFHNESWDAADDEKKKKALVWATRLLGTMVVWEGYPQYAGIQSLQFPRAGLMDRGGFSYLDNFTIPEELKNATAELAWQLIENDRTADSDVETMGIAAFSVGPISFTFADNVAAKVLPDSVIAMIPPEWIASITGSGGGMYMVPVERA